MAGSYAAKAMVVRVDMHYPCIEVRLPSGEEPSGAPYSDVKAAFERAYEIAGCQIYSDGCYLDLEDLDPARLDTSNQHAVDLALGVVVSDLVERGYDVRVEASWQCHECDTDHRRDATCPAAPLPPA
jgi:hypothetical protein